MSIKREIEFLLKTTYSKGYNAGYKDGLLAGIKLSMNNENERKERNEEK